MGYVVPSPPLPPLPHDCKLRKIVLENRRKQKLHYEKIKKIDTLKFKRRFGVISKRKYEKELFLLEL
jgi:hypothetical protein